MDIIAMTRALGAELQKDPRYLAVQMARQASDDDDALQEGIGAFNLLRMNLNEELGRDGKDQAKIDEFNGQLRECYSEVMSNPHMLAYNDAKQELDALVRDVTAIVTLCANGEDPAACEPASCGGDCAGCSGCH